MARSLDLIVNTQNSSLLSSFNSTSLSPSTLNFIFGDTTPITVRLVEPSESDVRPWRDIDLTGQLVRVAIGSPGGLPTAGTFTLSYDGDTTAELTHAATAAQISAALNSLASITAAGGVSVSSARTGIYRIVFADAGVTEDITASTASLYPTTAAFIAEAQEGTVESQSVFIVRLEVQPAAYLELTDDFPAAAINVTATREGDVGISEIQSLFLNPAPYGGIYNLSYDGEQTADIAWDATAATIQAALAALASPDLVGVTVTGDFPLYNVVFSSAIGAVPLITGDGSALLVPTGRSGSISINTTGVVELLSGSSRADVTFEVELVDEITGESWTPLQNPAVFREDLIPSTPAAQTTGPVYLLESVANTRYLRFDAAQTLTTPQKAQAVANLGLGTLATQSGTFSGTSSGTNTGDETGARIASLITAATSKTTPVDADEIPITDSAASFGLKKLTFANLKTALNTLYVALTGNQTIAGDKTFSGQTELTGQAATNSTSAMTRDLGDARYAPISVSATPTTDLDISNSTTFAADTDLALALTSGTWEISGRVHISETIVSNSAGSKARIDVTPDFITGSSSYFLQLFSGGTPTTFTSVIRPLVSFVTAFPSAELALTSSRTTYKVDAIIKMIGTGTLNFEWAQNVSNATPTRRYAGSYMTARRIGN